MAAAFDNTGSTGQVSTNPANEMAGKDDRVRVAQLTAIYRQGRISNLASPVVAAIVGYVLLTESAAGSIFIWLALVGLASVARGIVHQKFGRDLPAAGTVSDSTRRAFLTTICLSGLAWGVGVPLIFPVDNLALQAFLIVVVLGMGAGAMASFGPYFPALAVYVVPLIVPVAAVLMFQQTTTHVAFATFGIIFLVVLLLLGSAGHRNFTSSVRLEFENAYLALGLEHAQRRLDDAVDSMSEAFALFDADDRLVLANGQLRELVPELNGRSDADITYREFLQLFAQSGLTGKAPEKIDSWVEEFARRHRTPGEPFEIEVADGQWLRVSERSTSDDGVVSIFSDLTQLKTIIRDVAEIVRHTVPNCEVEYAEGASADARSYRVDFTKLATALPDLEFRWDAEKGAKQVYDAVRASDMTEKIFLGRRHIRLNQLKYLMETGQVDESLHWV